MTRDDAEGDRADELLQLLSRLERLETFPRTGWLTGGVQNPESISAHLYEVAVVTLWLADAVEADIETERALRLALLHDVGEAMLTDLPRPVKHFIGAEAVDEAETEAADTVLGDLGEGWFDAVEEYERLDSPEARLVKAADRIQMLAKSLQYDSQDRGDVDRFWEVDENFRDFGFPLVSDIMDRLREHFERGSWYPNDFA